MKFLHMGINPGCKQMSLLGKLPVLSWWEGPDGSRVLLGFSPGYGWMGWGRRRRAFPQGRPRDGVLPESRRRRHCPSHVGAGRKRRRGHGRASEGR
ncbi:MAG: hypothetical protein IKL96_02350 [Kiritimatiellae bacterium]|nr:hypothetical protein [Kiritimatiellia bacterium]